MARSAQDEIYYYPDSLPESDTWHRRTRWPQQFHGRRLAVFLWAATFQHGPSVDWVFQSNALSVTSTAADEAQISVVLQAADQVLDRCFSTMRATSRELLC